MKRLKLVSLITFITMVGLVYSSFAKSTSANVEIIGAGSTFVYPLHSKMFSEYFNKNGVKVNYQSIGSGGGIKQLMSKTVDFGASDAFLSDDDISKFSGPVVHVPTCMGAVILTYNLPGNPSLKFTSDIIADIFLGKITKWDDNRIKSNNPGVLLPSIPLMVVHRSDGSGTTFIWTDYLSKISEEWNSKVGRKTSVDWPVGLGAKGNEGVSGMIKQTPGSVGYVEMIYALQNKMPVGLVKNKSGKYVEASIKSVTAAANTAIPNDERVSITNTDAVDGYPISSFTWILLYKEQNYNNRSVDNAKEVVKLVWWMTHEGQQYTSPLFYAPLSKEVIKITETNLKSVVFSGKPLLQ